MSITARMAGPGASPTHPVGDTPHMPRRRPRLLAVPLVTLGLLLVPASGAAAAPAADAGCVAQFVHGALGPPGEFQRQAHVRGFGYDVAVIARTPHDRCLLPPS